MASSDERLVVGTVSTIKWIQINSVTVISFFHFPSGLRVDEILHLQNHK